MITAIIRNKDAALILEFPWEVYDLYERLQSIGIAKSPKQIPLTDNEDEDKICACGYYPRLKAVSEKYKIIKE